MMFKPKNDMTVAPNALTLQAPKRSGVPTIVSADMVVQGSFKSEGELQVEGIVLGDITVGKLVISEGGAVTGDVQALDLRVCGSLQGSARAKIVTLTASAVMTGDVHHELLTIEKGAQLEGHCRRLREAPEVLPEIPAVAAETAAPVWSNGYQPENHQNAGAISSN